MKGAGVRRVIWGAALGMAMGAIAGCEQMPWQPKSPAHNSASSPDAAANPLAAVPPHEVVAKINTGAVSITDLELAVAELRRFVEASDKTWKPLPAQENADELDLYDVLQNLEETELKAQDARARGLDMKPEVSRRLGYLQRGFYAQEWERWERDRAVPTEEQIHQFYEQNKAGFTVPERIHVRQIVTDTLSQAEAIRSQVVQGEGAEFSRIAQEQSIGPGRDRGGDIGWYMRAVDLERQRLLGASPTESAFFPQLEPVAFALEVRQASQPVKGPDGKYVVLELVERTSSRQQTELEVRDAIKDLLTIQTMQQRIAELRAAAKGKIEEFRDRLQAVKQ